MRPGRHAPRWKGPSDVMISGGAGFPLISRLFSYPSFLPLPLSSLLSPPLPCRLFFSVLFSFFLSSPLFSLVSSSSSFHVALLSSPLSVSSALLPFLISFPLLPFPLPSFFPSASLFPSLPLPLSLLSSCPSLFSSLLRLHPKLKSTSWAVVSVAVASHAIAPYSP